MGDMGITDHHQKGQLTTAPAKKGGKKQEEKTRLLEELKEKITQLQALQKAKNQNNFVHFLLTFFINEVSRKLFIFKNWHTYFIFLRTPLEIGKI